MSNFHKITQNGSKMCHGSVTGVTGVTQPGMVHDIESGNGGETDERGRQEKYTVIPWITMRGE